MLLDAGTIHFFASDAHDTERRPPLLSVCYQTLAKEKGEEVADLLLRRNPEAVINGQPLPAQLDWAESPNRDKNRRWFSFLWRR